jgi:hypothetical protein
MNAKFLVIVLLLALSLCIATMISNLTEVFYQIPNLFSDSEISHIFKEVHYNEGSFNLQYNREDNEYNLTEVGFIDESFSYGSAALGLEHTFNARKIEHFPHDMILSYFCEVKEHDPRIHEVLGQSGIRDMDDASPDIVYSDKDGNVCFVEITTTRDPGKMQAAFDRKFNNYDGIARFWRANLLIIVVSHSSVLTNVQLDQRTVDILSARYRYGLEVQNEAKELGWLREVNQEKRRKQQVIEDMLEDQSLIEVDDIMSTGPEIYSLHKMPYDETYLKYCIRDAENVYNSKLRTDDAKVAYDRIDKYKKKVETSGERTDQKAVVPFCLFSLKPNGERTFHVPYDQSIENTEEGALMRFWRKACRDLREPDYMSYEEASNKVCEREDEKIERKSKERQKIRAERSRIEIRMSDRDREVFSTFGVGAKRYKDTQSKQLSDQNSRKAFKWNTDTSDINDFILNSKYLFDESEATLMEDRLQYLYDYSNECDHESTALTKKILSSKIGQMMLTNFCINNEIDVNARKSTQRDEWIVVKSAVAPCLIAIKTTQSNKHIFYSILFNRDDLAEHLDRPFRSLRSIGNNWLCTPVCSLNTHDLSIWLSNPSLLLSMSSTWMDVFETEYDYITDESPEILACLLMAMENKDHTSSPSFNTRYMYMEMLKPWEFKSDPFKVLSKFQDRIRSRYMLWMMHRICDEFTQMLLDRTPISFDEEVYESEDYVRSLGRVPFLRSYISGRPLEHFSVAVNLSYIGVFHNVDKGEKIHGFLKIFSKVISEEKKLRLADPEKMHDLNYHYKDTGRNLRSHEFSVDHARSIGRELKRHWKKKGLHESDIKQIVISALSDVTFEELATMKASANSENFKGMENPNYKEYEQKSRNKALDEVISVIIKLSDKGASSNIVFENFNKLMEILAEEGGIVANLFKKNQPTGVREIFVLTMISRIVIKFLETVSRSLCRATDNEYLTKGKAKTQATSEHYNRVSRNKKQGDYSMTVSDSADATTWCQRFIMKVFQVMYGEIFSEWPEMLTAVTSILNLTIMKRLELPKELLDLFAENPDIDSYDDNMNELKEQFLGISEVNDIIMPFKMLMTNRSNFMQGILHYTSSLIHAGHMLWVSSVIKKMFHKHFSDDEYKPRMITTTKVSSDDSSRISTIVSSNPGIEARIRYRKFLLWTTCFIETTYPLFTALLSDEKSSTGILCMIEEFNSYWTIVNTVCTPKIKWAYSSQVMKVVSSATERQNLDHNNLNDLIENGCRRTTVQVCEFGCMLNHYSTVGIATLDDSFFQKMFSKIFNLRSNMVWFYFLSHPVIGTSLGFQCTKWFNLLISKQSRVSEKLSRKKMLGEPNSAGSFDLHTSLPVGFAKNYYKFLEKLEIPTREDLPEILGNDFRILFMEARNLSETMAKIKLKTLSSSIMKAFSFASASKMHSTCSYICTMPCITIRSLDQAYKASLPAIVEELDRLSNLENEEISIDNLSFPSISLYEKLNDSIARTKFIKTEDKGRRRYYSKIVIPTSSSIAAVPLIHVVRSKWYSEPVPFPRYAINMSFNRYKEDFPWLQSSDSESFESFNELIGKTDILAFSDFIRNFDETRTTVVFQSTIKRRGGVVENILDNLLDNYSPGTKPITRKSTEEVNRLSGHIHQLDELEAEMLRLTTAPPEHFKEDVVIGELKNTRYNQDVKPMDVVGLQKRHRQLMLLCILSKYEDNLTAGEAYHAIKVIQTLNDGMVAMYTEQQPYDHKRRKHYGRGRIFVKFPNVKCTIFINDNDVESIETDNIQLLRNHELEISRFIKNQKLDLKILDRRIDHCICKRGNRFRFERNSKGTPIYNVREMDDPNFDGLKFNIYLNRASGISVNFEVGEMKGETLAYYPKFGSVDKDISRVTSLTDHWCTHTPISLEEATNLISNYNAKDQMGQWIKKTLSARVRDKGLVKIEYPGINYEDDEISEVTDSKFDLLDNIKLLDVINMESDAYDIDYPPLLTGNEPIIADTEIVDQDYLAAYENPAVDVSARHMYLRQNPFWDNYVDLIKDALKDGFGMRRMGKVTKRLLKDVGVDTNIMDTKMSDYLKI